MTTTDGITFKDVTTDDLAGMMMRGFSKLENRFDRLEGRVDGLEHRLNVFEQKVDHRFDALSLQIKTISQSVYLDHEPRIKRIEKDLEIA